MIPPEVNAWLAENHYGDIYSQRQVGGGCINNGMHLRTASGVTFFLKTNPTAPPDMFLREAEGLEALRKGDGPRVPVPYFHATSFLLLEDLSPAPRQEGYWIAFG